jgi:phosphonate transport system permease protein
MRKRWFFVGGALLFVAGLWILGASPRDLFPGEAGRKTAGSFLGSAFRPAFHFEDTELRASGASFGGKIVKALGLTVGYAVVAMSLALIFGIVGGVLGSRAWWPRSTLFLQVLRIGSRLLATAVRSVHELMWALLFLAAVGTSPLAIVFAIALPYGGTLAKVFSELLDEQDRATAEVIRATGGCGFSGFLAGVIPRALPDLTTYGMYRLECAIRSSVVMGFVGIPTIGYEIKTAFQDGHYREVWTYLYLLWGMVVFFEWWGGQVRERFHKGTPAKEVTGPATMNSLWKARGISPFLRVSFLVVIAAVLTGWMLPDKWSSALTWDEQIKNLNRFTHEIVPYPVREADGDWGKLGPWFSKMMSTKGNEALSRTFHLGTVSILLAGVLSLVGVRYAARSLSSSRAKKIGGNKSLGAALLASFFRGASMVGRAMPEFILAYLLLMIFGPTMWALILALAIHNGGILLRLGAEVVDNLPAKSGTVILAQGGSKSSAFLASLLPGSFNRLLLFLFYRWESCIREATILGMLGVLSLGSLISDAKSALFYDEMILWVALGAALVFVGDLTSDWVRSRLRNAST